MYKWSAYKYVYTRTPWPFAGQVGHGKGPFLGKDDSCQSSLAIGTSIYLWFHHTQSYVFVPWFWIIFLASANKGRWWKVPIDLSPIHHLIIYTVAIYTVYSWALVTRKSVTVLVNWQWVTYSKPLLTFPCTFVRCTVYTVHPPSLPKKYLKYKIYFNSVRTG